ncbi:glycerol-3-phosphate cytidylyltransferase [Parafrankia irregularis]|uniref:Glycerol-3-phosphate cytidylyltransferase n=1 Tax=Parafrankia irregularis TaxID=795642 RepID=A0A0S4QLH9_9ACTN|nr:MULTISPECIES: adenylyltransferase/cytidyltransferase family protein [Parafrankia]MBE3205702.1 adenylyltransferase/cytidyltransferase family protein [Parafrankia sp. CH37]CUU55398.1 glycerol-3-phosphate cytidylyltransferase [Parafrankia irregularis]
MTVVGYVPGVYDMFHIGHLNIIRRARGACDHLVVGVVTDEVVLAVKGHLPVVPLAERLEIVGSLRLVDEVVVDSHHDKFAMWPAVHYDVLFKGDDWQHTPKGRKLEADLATVGARVVYFPYTVHTSSTELRRFLSQQRDELASSEAHGPVPSSSARTPRRT